MNFKLPPPSSPLPTNSNPLPLTHTLTLHWVSPPLFPSAISKPMHPFCPHANPVADLTLTTVVAAANDNEPPISNEDQKLLILLRQRKTEEAWILYTQSSRPPNPTCLSRLLFQLSDQNTCSSLNERQLRHLDVNSHGLLAAAKDGQTRCATSIVKSMLRFSFLPHVKAWSVVVSLLAAFDEMPESGAEPDVLSYNVMIKLCASVGRKDVLIKSEQLLPFLFRLLSSLPIHFRFLVSGEKDPFNF